MVGRNQRGQGKDREREKERDSEKEMGRGIVSFAHVMLYEVRIYVSVVCSKLNLPASADRCGTRDTAIK